MIKMIISMIMVRLTPLNKPKLFDISSTESTKTFIGNPLLNFQFEDFDFFELFKFQRH